MTSEKIEHVCRIGEGEETCRYLTLSRGVWTCAKLNQGLKRMLDDRVNAQTIRARGDNCEGELAE